jgi:type VI secretion system protein ImpF
MTASGRSAPAAGSIFGRLAQGAESTTDPDSVAAMRGRSGARATALQWLRNDLQLLLRTPSLGNRVDLRPWPEVERSVLNYGMPSLAGLAANAIDLIETAARIRRAIEAFEPRLAQVRVIPQKIEAWDAHLRFRIEGEFHDGIERVALTLDTQIQLDSGIVRIDGDAES